jgi:hypothetical protein
VITLGGGESNDISPMGKRGRAGPAKKGKATTTLTLYSQNGRRIMGTQVLRLSLVLVIFFFLGCAGLPKEVAKPVETKKVDSVIEQFGFKTRNNFRQTQIDVDEEAKNAGMSLAGLDQLPDVLHFVIRTKILPAILELEHRELINGFYFIMHEKLDLRLSCDSWEEKEQDIRIVLTNNGIPPELVHYSGLISDDFQNLDANNLEMNSRFVLAYLSIWDRASQEDRSQMSRAVPARWIHYLYNQFGYINLVEAISKFDSAFFQLKQGYRLGQCDRERYVQILEQVKARAEATLQQMENN